MDALTIFIFAAVEGVCDTPLQFLAKFFSYWGYSRMAYTLRFPANYWQLHFRRHGGRMRYAPTVFGENLFLWGYTLTPCERSLPKLSEQV